MFFFNLSHLRRLTALPASHHKTTLQVPARLSPSSAPPAGIRAPKPLLSALQAIPKMKEARELTECCTFLAHTVQQGRRTLGVSSCCSSLSSTAEVSPHFLRLSKYLVKHKAFLFGPCTPNDPGCSVQQPQLCLPLCQNLSHPEV